MKLKTLSQLRESYPEYNDWSDEELLGGIHQKYFSNMPLSDYYEQVGFSQAVESENIDQEISNQLGNTGWTGAENIGFEGDLTPYLTTAPKEPNMIGMAITGNPTTHALTAGSTGVENINLGIQQLLSGLTGANTEELAARDVQNEALYEWTKNQKTIGGEQASPIPAMVGRFGGEMAATSPALAIPGWKEAQVARTLGTSSAKLLPYLQNYFSKAALQGGATGGAAYVGEGESRGWNAGMSGLASVALSKLFLTPQLMADFPLNKMFPMSNLPVEELLKRNEAAKGTETPLYNITDNLDLKSFEENILAALPYSGVPESNLRLNQQMKGKGSDILKESTGRQVLEQEDVPLKINKDMSQRADYKIGKANEDYKQIRSESDKQNINVRNENAYKNAEEKSAYFSETDPRVAKLIKPSVLSFLELEKSLKPGGGGRPASEIKHLNSDQMTNAIKNMMEDQRIYKGENRKGQWSMITEEGPSYKPGNQQKPLGAISVTLADSLRSKELETARKFAAHGDDTEAYIMNSVAEAQRKDIDDAIDLKGSPELKKKLSDTREFYKNEVVPITENKFLAKYSDEDSSLVGLESALNDNKNIETFKNFMGEKSTQAQQDVVALFFQDAIDKNGEVIMPKFISTYNQMDPTKRKSLGLNEEKINSFIDLYSMNPEAANPKFNPKSGVRALPLKAMMGTLGAGYTAGGVPGLIAAMPVAISLSKYATNKLRSEGFREQVVNGMVAEKLKQQLGNFEPGSMEFDQLAARIGQYEQKAMGKPIKEFTGTPGWKNTEEMFNESNKEFSRLLQAAFRNTAASQ